MERIKSHTALDAINIVKSNSNLKELYNDLELDYEDETIDEGFEYGNFFSIGNGEICIQWLDDSDNTHEYIASSLEEAIVAINDIETANGNIKA